MKNSIYLLLAIFFGTSTLSAQDFSDIDKSPMDVTIIRNENHSPMARVIYSKPSKNDRDIFGSLVPYGEIWRTGANEATEVTIYNDMTVMGKKIPAGTYTLYTIPNKTEWTVILNKNIHVWGTANNYNADKDLVRIKAPARTAAAPIEEFSMAFQPITNGANLLMGWDNTYIEIPFKNAE